MYSVCVRVAFLLCLLTSLSNQLNHGVRNHSHGSSSSTLYVSLLRLAVVP
jgi:hypothetical protein